MFPFRLHFARNFFMKMPPGYYLHIWCIELMLVFSWYSLPKYESSHDFQTKKKRQQQRKNEEQAKRQKLQHPQQHTRLPPIQHGGRGQPQHWHGPNHPTNNSQPSVHAGPTHHQYGRPHGLPGGPNRYPSTGNPSGGYNPNHVGQVGGYSSAQYPQRSQQPYGSSVPTTGPRGATSGYGVAPPNYSHSGQYGGASAGRGPNPVGGVNRNQQYGWQQ